MRSLGWLVALGFFACRSAPQPHARAADAPDAGPLAEPGISLPPLAPQPGSVIAEVEGIAVLALAAPQFASLGREQRLLAWSVAQAFAQGEAITIEQGYRHNLARPRMLRTAARRSGTGSSSTGL